MVARREIHLFYVFAAQTIAYPFGPQNAACVPHAAGKDWMIPYRYDKYNDLFKSEKKDTAAKKDTTKKAEPLSIRLPSPSMPASIMDRLEQISPSFGSQRLLAIVQKDTKTTILYASNHSEGRNALWKTVLEPFEANKTDKVAGTDGSAPDIVESGDKLFALQNGTISKLNLDAGNLAPVNISYVFRRNLSAEFSQMFYEAWAEVEENYYDEHFHGVDWKKIRSYYAQFLPYMSNRSDIRTVLNDMLGELNSSHQGFYTFGGDEDVPLKSVTMETGIIFDNDAPYTVKYIVKHSNADKKSVDVKARRCTGKSERRSGRQEHGPELLFYPPLAGQGTTA